MPGHTDDKIRAVEMETMEVTPDRLMDLAAEADEREMEMMPTISGDFSLDRVNKVVDSLNRVNKVFKAPMYPKFEKAPDPFPPEFIKNLEMVDAAIMSAELDEYKFDLSAIQDDEDLKSLAGKLDAAASDKSFKAFLNKPLGMGEFQMESDVPNVMTKGTQEAVQSQPRAEGGDAELDLFMSRMA